MQNAVKQKISSSTPEILKAYAHYGDIEADKEGIKAGFYDSVDFGLARNEDLKEMTANMTGFGCEQSQRVIIDYDAEYGYFLVRRYSNMKYGTPAGAP